MEFSGTKYIHFPPQFAVTRCTHYQGRILVKISLLLSCTVTFRDISLCFSRPGSTVFSKIKSPVLSVWWTCRIERNRFICNYSKQTRTVSTTLLVSRKRAREEKQNSLHTKICSSLRRGWIQRIVVTVSTRVRGSVILRNLGLTCCLLKINRTGWPV